jgi:hypothetical protein
MTRPPRHLLPATFLALALSTGSAFAATWPASVVGSWRGVANQTTVKLEITNQDPTGKCKAIKGTMSNDPSGGDSNIQGFYCPESGRLSFVRKDTASNDAFQSYSANLSDAGAVLRVGGTFAELNMTDHLGEYNFCAEMRKPHH